MISVQGKEGIIVTGQVYLRRDNLEFKYIVHCQPSQIAEE
jgi:hypothetical protein